MKKEYKAIIAVVLAVWFFLMGFELGTYRERQAFAETITNKPADTTEAPTTLPPQTLPPVTDPPATQPPVSDPTQPQNPSETTAPQQEITTEAPAQPNDPSKMTEKQILANMATAINAAKNEQKMVGKKVETITINVTDCSIPAAISTINRLISTFAGEERYTYSFEGGKAVGIDEKGKEADDGAVLTANEAIPPSGKTFNLPETGVTEATAQMQNGNIVYTVKLVPENTSLGSPVPQYHSTAYGYLDLTSLDLPGVSITGADMHYPGTTITAEVNPDGKLVKLHFLMPMNGSGEAKIPVFGGGSATFEGSDDEIWEFTY